jgi:DNA helicase-2/ATP-dependent DNA helicase PcrA
MNTIKEFLPANRDLASTASSGGRIEMHKMEGPLLLLAGPGTGKTYQLSRRIKFLVEEQQVNPKEITVITFTAAAAANMRARISDPRRPETFIQKNLQPESICTMHSLGFRIIREGAALLGLAADLSIVQSDPTKAIFMGDAAQLAGFQRAQADQTSRCRQMGHCMMDDSSKCRVCKQYCSILRACDAIDYDDQILLACKLLRDHSAWAARYRAQASHLLVDEYQDINHGQFELIQLLSTDRPQGLFVVGDDDQSIYSWRGGSPQFIRNFEMLFKKGARVESLLHSRRCHRKVLEGSLRIVENYDKDRRQKGTFTYEADDGPPILIHNVPSDKREAVIVVQIIREALPSKKVLVLVPSRAHATLICERLRKARIKYLAPEPQPGEGLLVLERLAAWIQNSNDNIALRECLETVLGTKQSPVPSSRVRTPEKVELREQALQQVSNLWRPVLERGVSLWQSLTESANRSRVLGFAHENLDQLTALSAADDLAGLLAQAGKSLQPWRHVNDFLEEVANWVSRPGSASDAGFEGAVQVMTFQGAKGLEADTVCVVGLEEGTLPRSGSNRDELAEQGRLLFVSMTRSKHDLHLFHARSRSGAVSFKQLHRSDEQHTLKPSPFLSAIPRECAEEKFHPAQA